MAKATVAFSLDPEQDRDILAWLAKQGNRSLAIREAIRATLRTGITLGDVYREVAEVRRLLKRGVVVANVQVGEQQHEDPTVTKIESQLASLGL